MSGGMSLLRIQPDKYLEFKKNDDPVSLQLENLTGGNVAYKIKTTAPKNYQVRPSSGVITPNGSQDISIRLQFTGKIEAYTYTDRFLIQAVVYNDTITEYLPKEFWNDVEKSTVQDHRITVILPTNKKPDIIDRKSFATSKIPSDTDNTNNNNIGTSFSLYKKNNEATTNNNNNSNNNNSNNNNNNSNEDEEAKYNDLLHYCLAVEKQKAHLAKENETLQEQLNYHKSLLSGNAEINSKSMKNDNDNKISNLLFSQEFKLWHIISIIISAVLILKVFNKICNILSP